MISHPIVPRGLSPITELTTPTSPRIFLLPHRENSEEDYASEHEGEPPSPVESVYSSESSRTMVPGSPSQTIVPLPAPLQLPDPPSPPARSAKRPPPLRLSSFGGSSVPSPRSLPPPPRPRPQRITPPPSPRLPDDGFNSQPDDKPTSSESRRIELTTGNDSLADRQEESAGVAGAGTGGGSDHIPPSYHSSTGHESHPADLGVSDSLSTGSMTPSTHPILYNIPYLPVVISEVPASLPTASSTAVETRPQPLAKLTSPPASSPASLKKKRPHSYSGSGSGSFKSKPVSSDGGSEGHSVIAQDGHLTLAAPGESSSRTDLPSQTSGVSPSRSESSLDSPSREPGASPRQRTVSSIFSALFERSPQEGTSATGRRLSLRRSRNTSRSSGMATRGSSPVPPLSEFDDADAASPVHTAIRTSGTFGIQDDGSEMYVRTAGEPITPRSLLSRQRSQSGSGSVQSDGVSRVLFINNLDEAVNDEGEPAIAHTYSPAIDEDGDVSSATYQPFATPASNPPLDGPLLAAPKAEVSSASKRARPPIGQHRRSLSPPSARSAMYHPLKMPREGNRPLTPPPTRTVRDDGTTALNPVPVHTDVVAPSQPPNFRLSSITPIPEIEMIDEGVQTTTDSPVRQQRTRPSSVSSRPPSLVVSSSSHVSQPLPRTPDRRPRPQTPFALDPGSPFFHFPPPPPSSPSSNVRNGYFGRTGERIPPPPPPPLPPQTSDLPILIASHLLSSHAAALMRHSSVMRDASEVMHQMAEESLAWGGRLLNLGTGGGEPSNEDASGTAPPSHSRSTATTSGAQHPDDMVADPVHQAYLRLLNEPGARTYTGETLRTDYPTPWIPSPPAHHDRLTPIPLRPTHTRSRSRLRSDTHETLTASVRQRPESLPADWLSQADSLGRDGWNSLRAAEQAWSTAMSSLREIVEPPQTVAEEGGEETVRARTRSPHFSLDARPTSAVWERTHPSVPSDTRDVRLPSWSTHATPGTSRECVTGYTETQLGGGMASGEATGHLERSASHPAVESVSTLRGTRKLSKARPPREVAPPIPSQFQYTEDIQSPQGGSRQKGKKHWWSRKRATIS